MSLVYRPSPRDILHVSALLACKHLPPELIDIILECAEYWACITTILEDGTGYRADGRQREHVRLLQSKPICSGAADQASTSVSNESINGHDTSQTMSTQGMLRWGVNAVSSGFQTVGAAVGLLSASDARNGSEEPGSRARYYKSLPDHLVPEPRSRHPVRRIRWKLVSRDQGWGGDGGDLYDNSWTGFRGNALRFEPKRSSNDSTFDQRRSAEYLDSWNTWTRANGPSLLPAAEIGQFSDKARDEDRVWPQGDGLFRDTCIQVNQRAKRDYKEHVIVWSPDDDINPGDPRALEILAKQGRGPWTGNGNQVRALARGDVVELWSFAFFPGWSCHVDRAEFTIEFAL